MKAVILAAGKGTRMGELTAHVPKPMKEVDGKPILQYIVEGLRDAAGVRDFFIVIGWCGHVIRDHFGDGSAFDVRMAYGEQAVQDGTGKAPEIARDWIGMDRFVLTYGDILLRPPTDYAALAEAFREDGVIALKDGADLTKGGAVVLDERGFMIDLVEKAAVAPANAFYNAGHLPAQAAHLRVHRTPGEIAARRIRIHRCAQGQRRIAGDKLRGVIAAAPPGPTCAIPPCWLSSIAARDPIVGGCR